MKIFLKKELTFDFCGGNIKKHKVILYFSDGLYCYSVAKENNSCEHI